MDLIELTREGELEYAPCPPSGRKDGDIVVSKELVLSNLKPISIRKPVIMAVGSVATQGSSNNDIDLVIRGEDLNDKIKEAIDFRLYRMFTDILKCDYDDITKYVHIHYNNAGSYTSYIPLYELVLMPISNSDVVNMGSVHLDLKGNFDIITKSGDNRRIIAGYASVIEVDKENHIIPRKTLEEGIKTLLRDSEYSNLMLVHQNIQIGKIIPKYGDLYTHVDDRGLFIVAELRSDLKIANQVWKEILNGKWNGFSIAGEIVFSHKECDNESCVRVIDKMNIFEVSICDTPVNPKSGFIVVSKGDSLQDVKDVFNIVNKNEKQMSEEEEKCIDCEIEKSELETLTLDRTLEELSRQVAALTGIVEEMQNKYKEENKMEESKKPEEMKSETLNEEKAKPKEEPTKYPYPEEKKAPKKEEPTKYPYPEEKKAPKKEKPTKYPYPEDEEEEEEKDMMVSLSEYTDFVAQYLKENPDKTLADAASAWKEKKGGEKKPKEDSKYPYPLPSKKDFDELKNSVDALIAEIRNSKEISQLELAIKSKDDTIAELTKRIEILEKSEALPKTTVSKQEAPVKSEPMFIRDTLGKGIYYRNPDYY